MARTQESPVDRIRVLLSTETLLDELAKGGRLDELLANDVLDI